jgi:hypothetical protein
VDAPTNQAEGEAPWGKELRPFSYSRNSFAKRIGHGSVSNVDAAVKGTPQVWFTTRMPGRPGKRAANPASGAKP